jgi:tetratricopeptide (TPR) repeat protein
VLADRGQYSDAETLAREAVAIIARTDGLNFQADALCDLAEVLAAAGREDEAAAALTEALDRYDRKRNIAMSRWVRGRLAELQPA